MWLNELTRQSDADSSMTAIMLDAAPAPPSLNRAGRHSSITGKTVNSARREASTLYRYRDLNPCMALLQEIS